MKLDLVSSLADRRSFLKRAGVTGLSLATAAAIGSKFGPSMQNVKAASMIDDADILNFALNLEYLEAEFYVMSTYGTTLVGLGVITEAETTGPTTGGKKVPNFSNSPYADLATALRNDEVNHVKYLRSALGSNAVKKPAIDLDALGYGYTSVDSWLELARQFEDVGTSAYLGAAPLLTEKAYLEAAGAILSVEAFHAGAIRMACIMTGTKSGAVDKQDIPPTPSTVFDDTSSQSLAIPRTTSEVLNIVYGGGTSKGGFYPDGMNGTITSQS